MNFHQQHWPSSFIWSVRDPARRTKKNAHSHVIIIRRIPTAARAKSRAQAGSGRPERACRFTSRKRNKELTACKLILMGN